MSILHCSPFSEHFEGSLKSPSILEMIREILEFCTQCNTSHANSLNQCHYMAFSYENDPVIVRDSQVDISTRHVVHQERERFY